MSTTQLMCDFLASCQRPTVNIGDPNGGIEVRFANEKFKKFYFLILYWQLYHFNKKLFYKSPKNQRRKSERKLNN